LSVLQFALFLDIFHPLQFCGFSRLASINQTHLDFPPPPPQPNESFKNANKFQGQVFHGAALGNQPLNLSHLKYDDKQKQTAAEQNPIAFLFAEMHLPLQHCTCRG